MQDAKARVAELDFLAIAHRRERDVDVRGSVKPVRRAGLLRQLHAAGPVVGVDVRVDHLGNLHLLRTREADVRIPVACARIDNGALPERAAPKQIRGAPQVVVVERAENHSFLARMETLLTPHFAVAFCARSEINRYSVFSSTRST